MATENNNKGLIGGLLGDVQVNTAVGFTQDDLTRIGLTLFVTVSLIFLAWFAFRKYFK